MTHIRQSMLFSYALLYFHSEITEVFETKALHDRKIQTYFQCLEILSFKDNHQRGCYDCPFLLDLWVSWAGLSLSMWFKNAGLTQYPTESNENLDLLKYFIFSVCQCSFQCFYLFELFPWAWKVQRTHYIFFIQSVLSWHISAHNTNKYEPSK